MVDAIHDASLTKVARGSVSVNGGTAKASIRCREGMTLTSFLMNSKAHFSSTLVGLSFPSWSEELDITSSLPFLTA